MLPKIIKFDTLARCGDEIWIEHNGQIYRLRKTRQDKLILTWLRSLIRAPSNGLA